MVVLHTAIAIVLVIGLIIRLRVDPVISLILGSLYLAGDALRKNKQLPE